jgi:hypothetical protein
MPNVNPSDFRFLEQGWPDLYDLTLRAGQAVEADPDVSAIRLRGFSERMVQLLFAHFGLPHTAEQSLYDRLILLERDSLLERGLLAKFHTIRKFGNDGAHGGTVTSKRAEDLVYEAWTLGCWFVRLMRPDVEWLFRPYGQGHGPGELDCGQPALPSEEGRRGPQDNVVAFPEDRVRRIREEVVAALAKLDPEIRNLRTRMSLREAFTEDLNEDQSACADTLEGFLNDPAQRIMLLKGDAGTGKTFMAKGLVEYLSSQGRQYAIGAPTGRAAKIIGEKTGRQARTLHSLIYDYGDLRRLGEDEENVPSLASFKVYASVAANRDSANTVYIVDEASLVSDAFSESDFFRSGSGYLLKDLLEYVGLRTPGTDRKIVFIGDPAQLTPVGMNTSPALDGSYLHRHYGCRPAEYRLTEIVRQGAQSSILANVKPLRKGIEEGVFRGPGFEFDDEVVRLGHGDLVPTYLQTVRTAGRDPIIITRSNAEAAEINRAVRAQIFPGRDHVQPGDRLIITSNTFVGGHFLANGEFVEVCSIEPVVERRSVRLIRRVGETDQTENVDIELFFRDIEVAIRMENGEQAAQQVKVIDTLLHDNNPGLSPDEQRALYIDFLRRHPDIRKSEPRTLADAIRKDPYFNAMRAKFGYAVTCHKAQGGEWDEVIVLCPSGGDPRNEDAFRWLYTAMTRARSRLFLVNPPEVRIKLAGPSIQDFATGTVEGTADQSGPTPLASFREALLFRARAALEGSSISIDDVGHHQYQEVLYCSRGTEGCRASLSYNRMFQLRSMTIHPEGPLADDVDKLISPLVGLMPVSDGAGMSENVSSPTRPFIAEFDAQFRRQLAGRNISVKSMKEHQWSLRYVTARDTRLATIDIYFDGKARFTRCIPINPDKSTDGMNLIREVIEIVTSEIVG